MIDFPFSSSVWLLIFCCCVFGSRSLTKFAAVALSYSLIFSALPFESYNVRRVRIKWCIVSECEFADKVFYSLSLSLFSLPNEKQYNMYEIHSFYRFLTGGRAACLADWFALFWSTIFFIIIYNFNYSTSDVIIHLTSDCIYRIRMLDARIMH